MKSYLLMAAALLLACGCVSNKQGAVPTTQVATDIDAATAKGDYWYDQPAVASVSNANYRKLFDECQHSILMRYFLVDRADFRSGLLTSKPLISQQFWEFWRRDVGSSSEIIDSSLATYRRTIRWQIDDSAGLFTARPRVLIEHYLGEEDRSAIAANIRNAVSSGEAIQQLPTASLTAAGRSKWYAIGRDEALEQQLAKDVQDRLQAK